VTLRVPRVRISPLRSQWVVGRGAPRNVTTLAYSVVAIFGPTASGKSAVAHALAARLATEVVSADALQVYAGMPILTNQSPEPTRLTAFRDLTEEVGNDPTAALAHAEIDAVRMKVFAAGLEHFKARGLADQSFVLWTNSLEDGPSHSLHNIPHIIWGSGGRYLKQGAYVESPNTNNNRVLNTLISAAIQDTGQTMEDFGTGDPGQLDVMLA